MGRIATLVVPALALFLAACDPSHNPIAMLDPVVAQQHVAVQSDPDKALAEKVKASLGLDAGQGASYGVEVTASDGTVALWGTVDSNAVRKRLVVTAAGVVGVKALRDHIQVDPGA